MIFVMTNLVQIPPTWDYAFLQPMNARYLALTSVNLASSRVLMDVPPVSVPILARTLLVNLERSAKK